MAFFTREKRVAKHCSIEISSQNVFYFSCNFQLSWGYDGKFSPFTRKVITGKESPLISSCSFGLGVRGKFTSLLSTVGLSLYNVVVFLTSHYFSP